MYSTDLSDVEWDLLEQFFPKQIPFGRPRTYSYREILNGIFYVLRTGCAWDMIPHDFPPKATCYHYFQKWRNNDTLEKIHTTLREQCRVNADRKASPTAAILDSKSVKSSEKGGNPPKYPSAMTRAKRSRGVSNTYS